MIAGIVASDIMIYTDGSVTENPTVTSCAFFIPASDTSGSWRLTPGSSIFSAELHGIKQALSTIYNYDHPPPGIHIFSDSSAAIKAMISTQIPKNKCIGKSETYWDVLNQVDRTSPCTGFPVTPASPEMKKTGRLASDEASSPSGNYITNELSSGEHLSILKKEWETYVLLNLKKCNKPRVQMKNKLGIIPWHHSKDRASSTCLHRLRSGHTHLNSFTHRINNEADPSCRHGCPEIENQNHVLIECAYHNAHRQKINSFFRQEKIPLNTHTLLGLDSNISPRHQVKINNLLTSYLIKTNIRFTA
jgi:hypothetical protein